MTYELSEDGKRRLGELLGRDRSSEDERRAACLELHAATQRLAEQLKLFMGQGQENGFIVGEGNRNFSVYPNVDHGLAFRAGLGNDFSHPALLFDTVANEWVGKAFDEVLSAAAGRPIRRKALDVVFEELLSRTSAPDDTNHGTGGSGFRG